MRATPARRSAAARARARRGDARGRAARRAAGAAGAVAVVARLRRACVRARQLGGVGRARAGWIAGSPSCSRRWTRWSVRPATRSCSPAITAATRCPRFRAPGWAPGAGAAGAARADHWQRPVRAAASGIGAADIARRLDEERTMIAGVIDPFVYLTDRRARPCRPTERAALQRRIDALFAGSGEIAAGDRRAHRARDLPAAVGRVAARADLPVGPPRSGGRLLSGAGARGVLRSRSRRRPRQQPRLALSIRSRRPAGRPRPWPRARRRRARTSRRRTPPSRAPRRRCSASPSRPGSPAPTRPT